MSYIISLSIDVDISEMRRLIRKVLTNKHAALVSLPKASLPSLAAEMYSVGLISIGIKEKPTFDVIIGEFIAGVGFQSGHTDLEEDLKKFLSCFNKVGGSFAAASRVLRNEWTDIIRKELNVELHL